MTSQDLQAIVVSTARQVFSAKTKPEIAAILAEPDFEFERLGADSIDITEFCFQVEEQLDIEIETADVFDHPTLSAFVSMLESRKKAA